MLQTALSLAGRGFSVFPCGSHDKRPIVQDGFRAATRDPEQIRAWWREYPDARVGVWPARCEPPLLVVDVDVKHGAPGMANLLEISADTPPTMEAATPSGGAHLFYRLPKGTPPIGNRPLAPGLDVRSENGYVVWYGAKGEPAEAPEGLLARCNRAQERAENADEWLCEPDLPVNLERAADWLSRSAPAIEGQGGDNWTYATAARLRGFGLSPEAALELMLGEWNDRCVPPWAPDELALKVANAYQHAAQPAGHLNPDVKGLVAAAQAAPVGQGGLTLLTVRQLAETPRTAPIIKSVLYERNLLLLVGAPSAFKSFIALDMACHIALGLDWIGCKVPKARDVLYIAAEGAAGIRDRLAAWQKHHGREPERLRVITSAPQFADGGAEQLSRLLRETPDFAPDVVFIDTLASVTAGLDESASRDMGGVVQALRLLIAAHGCAIVPVHHTGKDDKRGARGWSGLLGAADGSWMFESEPGEMLATMSVSKRLKDHAGVKEPRSFKAEVVELGRDSDGDVIDSLVMLPAPTKPGRRGNLAEQADNISRAQLFMQLVGDGGSTSAEMARAMAAHMLEEGATAKAKKALIDALEGWLSRIARGTNRSEAVAEVAACYIKDSRQWRRGGLPA